MDIKQLKYFLLVADMGGFTNAARAMGLGQSAISKQIKLLETEVGAQLFLRHGRGIVLTPAGRQLLDHARDITERIEVARADMSELSKSVAGEITCGLPASLGSTLTTPLLKRFLDSYPLVRLSLVEGLSGHLYEWLLRGDLDLAALYMPSVNNSLFSEFILSDQIYLVWANDGIPAPETIPFDEAVGKPLILSSAAHALRKRVEHIASQRNLKVNIRCQVDSIAAIRNLVLQGYGYALMPVSLIQSELEQGMVSCSRLVDPTLNRDLLLAMSPYTRNTPLTRTLRREIRQLVSDTTSGVLSTGH
ncbi:LysR family transcriptional regulator [Sulfitobacter sp. G21635-S1]|uniref:LysR family transcriptional regulator n=1 Tax=Sulfitobacter sp. G21635-S1 TaxID=3014043 RepID=UPI0022AECB56|nr:LysR family transcriptional regulator [Sulfitobacter sp. G21635-S1]MCZ4256606.1 LysR family transcriptional regulator [Sulfitobacter sp. G21635-S1]